MPYSRFVLPSITVLALAACAPADSGKDGRENTPPLGFELAAASELEVREALGQTGRDIAEANPAVVEIDVQDLSERLAQGNVRLIDVRTDEEVADGIIPGAEHIAMDEFDPAALDFSDGREVILYCRSGRRSGLVAERLAEFRGEPAVHLTGGILAWSAAGNPTEQP